MSTLIAIARKDLRLLLRDKAGLFWLFGLPLLFASFFGTVFGGSSDGSRAMTVCVIDEVGHDGSKAFLARLDESSAIRTVAKPLDEARRLVREGKATAYVRVIDMPEDGIGFTSGDSPELEVGIDPSRTAEGGMLKGVLMEAAFGGVREVFSDTEKGKALARKSLEQVRDAEDISPTQRLVLSTFLRSLETFLDDLPEADPDAETDDQAAGGGGPLQPQVTFLDVARRLDRPLTGYEISFPQALAWGLMSAAAGLGLTLVRERREGTLLRLRTAPVRAGTILGGKLLACFTVGLVIIAMLFTFGALVFGLRIHDPLAVVAVGICASASFAGVMMLLSTLGNTEQAVSGASWGVLLILAMLGGGMVPQFIMPGWMLTVGAISPVRWAIQGFEGATWRAYDFAQLLTPCSVLLLTGAVAFTLGWFRVRKRL